MRKLVTVLIILAIVGGGAYYYYSYGKVEEKPQVVETEITQGTITEAVSATGTLEPLRTVQVGSQVSGIVKELYVDFNSIVKRGTLIAELEPELLQVQVDLQSANVERQKGEIANQEVQLEDAKTQLARTQALFDKELANQQQLDQANLTVKTRTTALDSARKQLLTAEANLNQAKLNLSYTKIYSPIDGVIVNRIVDRGQTVQASMSTPQFFTIATDLRTLRLSAGVDEADIGKVRPGMRVTFQVDSYMPSTFEGTVENVRLNASTANNVVTYPVWINVPNPDLRLRPSMTANLRIIIQTAENVLRAPATALRFRPTADMYAGLGLTPPAQPAGRGGRAGRAGEPGATGAATAAQPAAPAGRAARGGNGDEAMAGPTPRPSGQRAQAEATAQVQGQPGGRTGGRGFGADLSPEERQRMREQFAQGRGQFTGRGGAGRGQAGGTGGRGGRGGAASNATAPLVELDAEKIDELFAPMQTRIQPGQVWQWDGKALTEKRLQIGISDGQFSQIISGDLKAGDKVVTNIILPLTAAQRQQQQSIFGQQPGRGSSFGPAQSGGFRGGDGGGGGGGGRGGGGGGR
jgi:HlyD family secretion protein